MSSWGLKTSANSYTPVEFRTCKIEIDYYPEFRELPEHEKEALRLARPNVAHNICFYLQAIKPGTAATDLKESELIVPPRRRWMIENNW